MAHYSVADVAKRLDHAVLRPHATDRDLAEAAAMCAVRGVGCLCVRPTDVARAAQLVAGSDVIVASVVGFPHGSHLPQAKVAEAGLAIEDGAGELDMVMQIGAFLSGRHADVLADIAAIVTCARPHGVLVKVILETCYLTLDEVAIACRLAEEAGADMVKTSTGFGTGGATIEVVETMLRTVGGRLGVKASGGVRTTEDAKKMLEAGADRIGASASVAIVTGGTSNSKY